MTLELKIACLVNLALMNVMPVKLGLSFQVLGLVLIVQEITVVIVIKTMSSLISTVVVVL